MWFAVLRLVAPPSCTGVLHTFAMSAQHAPPAPIEPSQTLDDVVDAIDSIIRWSIGASSRLGYFAAMYKRITIGVRTAVAEGAFEDGPRMALFDVAFANRYFDALNGYFHPGRFAKPTDSWQVTFGGGCPSGSDHLAAHAGRSEHPHRSRPGNLGAADRSRDQTDPAARGFQQDQRRAGQPSQRLRRRHQRISPALADVYAVLMQHQIFVINQVVRTPGTAPGDSLRVSTCNPDSPDLVSIWLRDRKVAGQTELIYDLLGLIGVIEMMVQAVTARESRDIVRNIQVLDVIASTPAPIRTVM